MVKVWGGAGDGGGVGGRGGKGTREKGSRGGESELFVSKTIQIYYPKCRKILIYREAVVGHGICNSNCSIMQNTWEADLYSA